MIIHREHKLFLVKVIVQKHSVIYIITLSWCCGSMSCVSHILFRMSLAMDVHCATYSVSLMLYVVVLVY